MQKKKFFIVMTALAGVSLVLADCPTDSDPETVYVKPGRFEAR
jgi:hypothetical protein